MSRFRSHEIFHRALELMPGGVNSPARAFGGVGGEPLVIERAEGAYLYDVDGNRYIDYIGSWGPMILGHGNDKVRAAIHAAVDQGTSFGAPTERENHLAELIIDIVPSVEKVRLVNSGTEATMSAIRLARGYTGRDKIIKFAGNYHGHVDSLLVAAGSAAATLGVPNSPGVTAGTTADTIVLPYNDVETLTAAFEQHGDQLACVIFEPIVGNMGTVVPTPDFLAAIRDLCTKHGAVMLMDEVMTGFRVALGGAQELFGVTPDLTTMGKIVGGGLPIAAYGGRADILNHVLPAGKVFQAGTLSGNPLATAAGIATLSILQETNPYPQLDKLSERLMTGLGQAATDAGVAHSVARVGSMATLFFGEGPVVDWDTAAKSDTKRYADFFWGLIDRGVYFPCSQFEALFLSVTHTEADIDATIAAAREALGA
ncbi:glutamate-1-semialdehyde 2,1-aminomutase [Blastopirellula retiformator]|uniref:Glutamate-1-semialdehyde 2,1-aminomutase n=1 Tax=Blastopirellula retiformator TaxID=2527970 RepID=A0A5C5UZG1_9BACT|nr:glutamate-1-semialdehyde 2,1-aminomutase [Blastopirellula retiformator]TWT30882.1 Glutamate-1-semialdehyde 2,1-aminomutase [Blastopirellula retiformator]